MSFVASKTAIEPGARRPGTLGRWSAGLRSAAAPSRSTHILIACMPKSGSTFLSDIISELPAFRRASLVPDTGRREQELDPACLDSVDQYSFVAQHHVRNSEWTSELCRRYRLKPVVLVRSLLEVVVSLRDHMRRESAIFPLFFAEQRHAKLDNAALEMMIARLALPWYINFYMSWRAAPDTVLIDYEQLAAAPVETVSAILAHSGVSVPPSDVKAAVERVTEKGESRFNVGQAGRGYGLQPDTIRAVIEMIDLYPEAAADRFVRSLRLQAEAVLSGEARALPRSTNSAVAVLRSRSSGLKLGKGTKRLVMRRALPLCILLAAALYWAAARDAIPDASQFGELDDALVLFSTAFLAGRLTKFK